MPANGKKKPLLRDNRELGSRPDGRALLGASGSATVSNSNTRGYEGLGGSAPTVDESKFETVKGLKPLDLHALAPLASAAIFDEKYTKMAAANVS